jgi:hypothetical protein
MAAGDDRRNLDAVFRALAYRLALQTNTIRVAQGGAHAA